MKRWLFLCALSAATVCAQNLPPIRSWADAESLETRLDARPDDSNARVALLRYYQQSTEGADRVTPLRRKHIVWLIEHQPWQSELGGAAGDIDPVGDPEGFAQASAAWQKALAAPRPLFDTYAHAVEFYRAADPEQARRIAEEGLKRYPGNAQISRMLGMVMANRIAGVKTSDLSGNATSFDESAARSREAGRDRQALETSDDPNLIAGAVSAFELQFHPLHTQKLSALLRDLQDLTVRLYLRAAEIDPNGAWKSRLVSAYRMIEWETDSVDGKIAVLEKAAAAAPDSQTRVGVLPDLGEQYLAAGETANAAKAANEVLDSKGSHSDPNYGALAFRANLLLGRVSLKEGEREAAERYLLAAGRAPNSDQVGPDGPTDWRLAEALLAKGERDSVLAYLELLHGAWKNDGGRLNAWAATIRAGGTPRFAPTPEFAGEDQYLGRPAPELRLKDLNGAEISLADYKGKVVLVDFWATWCPPCREEMPDFEKIHRDSGARDVVVLTLDVDEPLETVARYVEKEKLTFPVLLGKDTDAVKRYSVNAYPTTFVIDKNGLVAGILVGGADGQLRAAIAAARAGAPPPAPNTTAAVEPAVSSGDRPRAATADDLYRDAVRDRGNKDYANALKSLSRVLQLRPDWLQAVLAQAGIYSTTKQYNEAIAAYTRAIELDPKRASSYDSRGLAYSNSGRHAQAIPDYDRAIELNPDLGPAYNNRGWARMETGHPDEALPDLNKAIELNPTSTVALFNRAHLYERRREYDKAIADYDSILRVAPDNLSAVNQKAADLRRPGGVPPAPAAAIVTGIREVSRGATIHCQGKLEIPQTFLWDLDRCQLDNSSADFWFEAIDRQTRYITPKGGARLAVMGDKSAGYEGCSAAKFTAERIDVQSLKKGTFVCAETSQGRIAEFSIDDLYAKDPSPAGSLTLAITIKTWER